MTIKTEVNENGENIDKGYIVKKEVDIPFLQETTRSKLANDLIGILKWSAVGVAVYITVFSFAIFNSQNVKSEDMAISRELITLVWTSLVTLVSSALGFYFGSNTNNLR